MPAVSVIIPVYNVEKYLRECLDSVCSQTLEDIEIICVNDGSSDGSMDILKEYESNDSRISIISQENKGLSAARNSGLDKASGDYVYFIDSDDYIELDALEKLYNICKEKSLDCVIFKLINFDDDTKEKFQTKYYDMEFLRDAVGDNVFSNEDISKDIFHIAVSIPGKFFRRDLIEDMRFEEGLIFEDNPFFVEVLLKSKRLLFLDEYLYNRRVRQDSIITSNENFTDYLIISNRLVDLTIKYGCYEKYKPQLYEKILKNSFIRFTQVDDDNKQHFLDTMKEDFLSKKEEYDADEIFQNGDERLKEIFYRCIDSKTPKEYELYMSLFDTEAKLNDVIEQKRQVNRQRQILFDRTHDLSAALNTMANENRDLKKELES